MYNFDPVDQRKSKIKIVHYIFFKSFEIFVMQSFHPGKRIV